VRWLDALDTSLIDIDWPTIPGVPSANPPAIFDKWLLLEAMVKKIARIHKFDESMEKNILHEIFEREKMMSTGIGEQVAIPHATVEGIAELLTSVVVFREGVEFESIDRRAVYIVVMLVAPKEQLSEHLRTMAEIARALHKAETRQKIIQARSSEHILEIISITGG